MKIIELNNIEKTYSLGDAQPLRVLHNISFSVEKGEFLSIMGQSGSGKSTLLHILGLLDKETAGDYIFEGKISKNYSEDEMAHIRNERMGFVFQTFNLLANISVLENVKLPFIYSSVPEKEWDNRANEAIEAVGLSHRTDHDPARLSGGERQRVAIARALINKPDIIFADEPTGNLDSKSGQQVLEILERLHGEGHTVLLVTHETYTAEYAERVIRLHDGQIESDKKVSTDIKHTHFVK